ISVSWISNRILCGEPRSCGSELIRWKKPHRCATDAGTGKGKRLSFPSRLSHDGDLRNFTAVRDQKIEIIPIRAALPALEILENGEQAGFRSDVDPARKRVLFCPKFGSVQNATDSQHTDFVRLIVDCRGHYLRALSRTGETGPIGPSS